MTETVILKLLDILPHWMIISGVVLYIVHKICSNQMKYISKIIGKYLIKNNNTLNIISERLNNIEEKVEENSKTLLEHGKIIEKTQKKKNKTEKLDK